MPLMRLVISVLLGLTLLGLDGPLAAIADDEGYDGFVGRVNDRVEAQIVAFEQITGQNVGRAAPPGRERVCTNSGEVVPCAGEAGVWNSSRLCYATVTRPLAEGEAWGGETGGFLMSCTLLNGSSYPFWQPTAEVAPAPPDPAMLARRAVDAMGLAPIRMGMFPESSRATNALGYVGWNAWMWAETPGAETWGPMTAEASLDGYTVRATASVDRVVWDMGDGGSVTCQQGTPWSSLWTRNEPSPDCGYVYAHDGEYTVTATSYWQVEWAGIGEAGTFDLELSTSAPVRIAEIQVLNVPAR